MSLIRNIITAGVGNEVRKRGEGNGLLGFGLGVMAARIATRSIPGALLVGGAMVAKALYDRSKEEAADVPASEAIIDVEGKPVPEESSH
ncbi:hypothetical protein A8B75_18830 [Sphingomonadales bacterium EhC05]|jgi:hypothetical protein|uniref:hypothetical protein n=2 Tax=Parasphingorhabdus sp. TaxID=2709688 RepID=UPI0007F51A09|nr:hypothetical protein A8B75_18830 [Sphingomonadales bacterium EhC05]